MDIKRLLIALTVALGTGFIAHSALADSHEGGAEVCVGYGPQTPRDIDSAAGANDRLFSLAPAYTKMNLCNIHMHVNAEHKGSDFPVYAGAGTDGIGGGYQCLISQSLSKAELAEPKVNHCGNVKPGDTIEVHWVHSSCDVSPGKGLGSCLSESCANPDLRVETQVFTLVNDPDALDFADFSYAGNVVAGLHQVRSLPTNTGDPVEYLGSTTGPAYTEQKCSPLQVSWSVRPMCAKLDINSLSDWCADNVFEEGAAQGGRELVTDPRLLSPID